jgi:hypothetical protein
VHGHELEQVGQMVKGLDSERCSWQEVHSRGPQLSR